MSRGGDSRERYQRFNLVTGEDTYASQTAQNPATSRRLQSLIPSLAGDLRREKPNFLLKNFGNSPVSFLFEYDRVDPVTGNITRYYLANVSGSTQLQISTDLATWTVVPLPLPNVAGSTTGTLAGTPQAVVINNMLHLSDGTNTYLFDGTTWLISGMKIPQTPPSVAVNGLFPAVVIPNGAISRKAGVTTLTGITFINQYDGLKTVLVLSGVSDISFNGTYLATYVKSLNAYQFSQPGLADSTSGNGTLQSYGPAIQTNRYYWIAFIDQTANRGLCQSDVSPISFGTGAVSLNTKVITVIPRLGNPNFTQNSTLVTAANGATFTQADVGGYLYGPGITGAPLAIIAVSADGSQATLSAPYTGNTGIDNNTWIIAPARATHWILYASESENSQVGFQLAILPLGTTTATVFYDTSDFIGGNNGTGLTSSSFFIPIERPVRNDPPVPSKIQTIHKNRIFRRRENVPRNFNFTAFEEVSGNLNGSPQECTPGTDPNTLSDIVNEDPYPDSSASVRGICSHGEALYIGTEQNILPLYGESIDDFTLSQVVAFKVGFAGRFAVVSTPHGLAFVSYDKKVYLYPSQYPAGGMPGYLGGGDSTQYLIELSRPKRTAFEQMKSSDLDNIRLVFYNYGRRNWLVLAYQDSSSVYHTWVYDFETRGWFELQRGVASLAVFELPASGNKILAGGDVNGNLYVLDDLTVTYVANTNFPLATFRPALIDWGKPDHYHVFRYVEFEVDNVSLGNASISINYYIDPVNVDSPGAPSGTLTMSQVRGSNFFRGFVKDGGLCYRLLLEILVSADTNDGVIRGLNVVADEAASLIF